ncbi:MAG TPA: HAD family hydrolase [Candidatus Sulfotelmatobacter sp.]
MPHFRTIFFDVGNTLLFPNRQKILEPLAVTLHPSLTGWQALERKTKAEFDREMTGGHVDRSFWWTFHTYLLQDVSALNDGVRNELIRNTQNSANWDQILPGTRESLERIASKNRIAVISNADGKIDQVLTRCGICDCFQSITDSGIVGQEKPHPVIFEAALAVMDANPQESLYVGDVYSVDYLGARNAGMNAILFDVAGTYRDRNVPRVESMEELEIWLKQ